MPGHERFLRTMVAGAAGIGAALVVVSALEGPRAQTREHLEIAGLLGLRRAVVAVSFCDRATAGPGAAWRARPRRPWRCRPGWRRRRCC